MLGTDPPSHTELPSCSNLQEEVEVKTRKLKKVWNKLQQAQAECRDLEVEFQRERTGTIDPKPI